MPQCVSAGVLSEGQCDAIGKEELGLQLAHFEAHQGHIRSSCFRGCRGLGDASFPFIAFTSVTSMVPWFRVSIEGLFVFWVR